MNGRQQVGDGVVAGQFRRPAGVGRSKLSESPFLLMSLASAGRHYVLLLLLYLLLAVPLLHDIWLGGATDLDPFARLALSGLLLGITCPLFALSLASLWLTVQQRAISLYVQLVAIALACTLLVIQFV